MSYNAKMYGLGSKRSIIREIFEYSKTRAKEIGAENVFDFSLGNPSVPAPDAVGEALATLIANTDPAVLHGYTSATGDAAVRRAIAEYIEKTHGCVAHPDDLYLTVGAAAALTIAFHAILSGGEEVVAFAPFFPEYKVFVERLAADCVWSPAVSLPLFPRPMICVPPSTRIRPPSSSTPRTTRRVPCSARRTFAR